MTRMMVTIVEEIHYYGYHCRGIITMVMVTLLGRAIISP